MLDPSDEAVPDESDSEDHRLASSAQETSLTGTERPKWLPSFLTLLTLVLVAVNPLDFKTNAEFDRATSSLGVITIAKLALGGIAAGLGALALWFSPQTRRLALSIPGLLLLALGGVFCFSSGFAIDEVRTISRGAAVLFVTYLFFLMMAMTTLGVRRLAVAILIGSVLNLLGTWFLYLVFPDRGIFWEYINASETVPRMGGTGHPNIVGKTAVTTSLIALALAIGRTQGMLAIGLSGRRTKTALTLAVLLGIATLWATISRTALLAGLVAGVVMSLRYLYGRLGFALAIGATCLLMFVFLAVTLGTGSNLLEKVVQKITKSGDATELTSLTGRTEIWQEAIGFIAQRPLTGWGLDSAASVMSEEATGTHNLLLHITFSAGLMATALLLMLLGWSIWVAATTPYEWIRGIIVYVLVSGLVEDTVIESFPTSITLLWMMAMLAPAMLPARIVWPESTASSATGGFAPEVDPVLVGELG